MPEQVRCPSCDAALRVPENLLGKNVKCPKCQTTFLAEQDEPEQSERIVREPTRSGSGRRPSPPEEDDEPPEEEEDRPRRRRRRGRSTAFAQSAVSAPAICLMILGAISILAAIGYIIVQVKNIDLSGRQPPPPSNADPDSQAGYQMGLRIGKGIAYGWGTAGILWGIVVPLGALRMYQLKNYGIAMTTCILAMLPCNCCCVLGLPLGIWGMVVLNKPEVKNSFS